MLPGTIVIRLRRLMQWLIAPRRPSVTTRRGWDEAARAIAQRGHDALVMGEFGNADDAQWVW